MAFCSGRRQFAAGWLTGGNRRRFEALARDSGHPMGVLASVSGEPVGWAACGPRSRYAVATMGRSGLLRERQRGEDDTVWLVPCLFVQQRYRGHGLTRTLVRAVVDLARSEGARAIEGWPCAASHRRTADAFLGREEVFADLGFTCVDRPTPQRAIMRLELT